MKVSVVVCTYPTDRYECFHECVESVLGQTYEDMEVVLIIDGNEEVHEWTVDDFGQEPNVRIHCNDENRGISYSRTKGAELADGEIVAMIDDDATAEPDWIETLVETYETTDALAVGGDVRPDWQVEKPDFFPDEFYWLVGCVEPGFAEDGEEVRNTYGSNISYRRDVFLNVGGYDPNTGRKGEKHLQAHEAPAGIRMLEEYGRGMVFNEDAVVHHKLFDYRGNYRWLVSRSFWQGYSKRVMDLLYPNAPDDKSAYLYQLMTHFVPKRIAALVRSPSLPKVKQLITIFVFTAVVGLGYLCAMVTPDVVEKANA
ncbi:glucosyl-dolichyl phosphate glucuronosyltransferase [Haloarchaeobius sp. DT45]|uniref:glucosyl-dolichyl phosphate glucuronosyltransferase n=1 Tax=Haloarchaeobius sp. DT45 TaxID=3446116 RepID=UPI003F6C1E9B